MSIYKEKPLDRTGLKTIPLAERPAKVSVSQFARPYQKGEGVMGLIESMPRILAGESVRAVVEALRRAWDLEKPILWGLGGHVVKVGLGPTLIDLMERGFVSGIAMNGSTAIHDFEVALVGSTSEEVDAALPGGKFGMAEETGAWMNQAITEGDAKEIGIGEALITIAALTFILQTRPGLIGEGSAAARGGRGWALAGVVLSLVVVLLSPFASANPDGLERVAADLGFINKGQSAAYQIIPDYTLSFLGQTPLSTIMAGVIGMLVVLALALMAGRSLQKRS